MKETIRVLVVDDSPLIRSILVDMLESEPGFQVVGQAQDGQEAVLLAARLRPHVITMDIRMPRLNGLEATRQIMASTPTPIVVVASSIYESDLNIAFNAIGMGALTVVEKPRGLDPADYDAVRDQLVRTVRLMADVQVVTLWSGKDKAPDFSGLAMRPATRVELIAIAASTGGPGILRQILGALPATFGIPIIVVQHITPGFAQGFARWLDSVTPLTVALAQNGETLAPGRVLIAPEGAHTTLTAGCTIRLDFSEPLKGVRPSATPLFESVARSFGPTAVGVILTGMGDDGVDGLEALRRAGGQVIAQDEASCAVFGMPKVAIERGVVDRILTPDEMAQVLLNIDKSRSP
jgi:two-component system chemotaxis response regulator CheB